MGKYLITGRQGSGKTTVIKLLQHLGYTAYNTDDMPDVTKLQNRITNEIVPWPPGKVDWTTYAWNWQRPALLKLLNSADPVFIGAVTANQVGFYPLFDRVLLLAVSPMTLRSRLLTHEHASHHLPGEIDRIIADHERKEQLLIEQGAEPIPAERAPDEVANEVLRRVGLGVPRSRALGTRRPDYSVPGCPTL